MWVTLNTTYDVTPSFFYCTKHLASVSSSSTPVVPSRGIKRTIEAIQTTQVSPRSSTNESMTLCGVCNFFAGPHKCISSTNKASLIPARCKEKMRIVVLAGLIAYGTWISMHAVRCTTHLDDSLWLTQHGCASMGRIQNDDDALALVSAECNARCRGWAVRRLVSHAPEVVNARGTHNVTALHECAVAGCLEGCMELVEAGASALATDDDFRTPFAVTSDRATAYFLLDARRLEIRRQMHTL